MINTKFNVKTLFASVEVGGTEVDLVSDIVHFETVPEVLTLVLKCDTDPKLRVTLEFAPVEANVELDIPELWISYPGVDILDTNPVALEVELKNTLMRVRVRDLADNGGGVSLYGTLTRIHRDRDRE